MIQRQGYATKFWLIGIAIVVGGGWFFGLMPGMDPQIRADSQGNWTPTGLLHTARTYRASATLLSNGQVLLAGGQADQDESGQGHYNSTAITELYDPVTGIFSLTGLMTASRAGHTATRLDDGRVLLVGGVSESGTFQSTAEIYDPIDGTFTETGSMSTGRAGHVAIKLPGGQVLIVGGLDGTHYLGSAEIYDPTTAVFSPTGAMQAGRAMFSAVLLKSGNVLVVGGYDGQVLDSAELYNPSLEAFTLTGFLQTGRADFSQAVLLQSGEVLVVGGLGPEGQGLSSAEIYSPESGTFSLTGSMGTGRQFHSTTLLPNGQVLVAGGWTGIGGTVLNSVELFHPGTGNFSAEESLVTERGFHTATLLDDGTVLVTGGSGEASFSSLALGTTELFLCPNCQVRPEAPTQVAAEDRPSDEGGAVVITWAASSSPEVQEYRVYSRSTPEGPLSLIATLSDTSMTSYYDTGLANGVLHQYVVRAFDGNRESEDSNQTSAMALDNITPESPTSLTIADLAHDDGTALSISWIPSTSEDIAEQRIYRGVISGGPFNLVTTIPGNGTTTFVDHGLAVDTKYYYVLSAFDGTHESPISSESVGQTQDNRPVAKPIQFSLDEDAPGSITLLGETDEEGHQVTSSITTPPAHYFGIDTFSYIVADGDLASQPANVVLTVMATNDPPTATDDALTVKEDSIEVHLDVLENDSVDPDTDEALTIIEVTSPDQGGSVKIASDNKSLLYTPIADWSGNETFRYTISDGSPNSQATAVVVVTVTPVNDPPSVAVFRLSWTPPQSSGVVEQRIYRSRIPGGPYEIIAKLPDSQTDSFVDASGLDIGMTYHYVVRTFNGGRLD